jgi:hypothetical protein
VKLLEDSHRSPLIAADTDDRNRRSLIFAADGITSAIDIITITITASTK